MARPPIEPSAEQRQAALACRSIYLALLETGFTEPEALQIVGFMLDGSKS